MTGLILSAMLFLITLQAKAQMNLSLFTDNLVNGFQDWSFNCTRNFANTSPTNSGAHSLSVTITGGFGALDLEQNSAGFDSSLYTSVSFWINGGSVGGQQLQVFSRVGHNVQPAFSLPKEGTNVWQQIVIPLSAIGAANKTNFTGIGIQGNINSSQPVFYVDDFQLNAAPAPALVHIGVDASQAYSPQAAWTHGNLALNTATRDGSLQQRANSSATAGVPDVLPLRWPGGLTSGHLSLGQRRDLTGNAEFQPHLATNLNAQVFVTVNYHGSGTSNEAAAWVLSDNVTNHCGFKYWEIGNECYGSWETNLNDSTHDPFTYATRAAGYFQLMKAADHAIKIGVVAVTGEDSYSNNATHFETNPRTGIKHYGWTPVMLATLKNLGITPDFVVYHFYPQFSSAHATASSESDPLLLQAAANWASDAADLRQQITDYFGPAGTNIELVCTENNSDAGVMGRQSTGIVNALYLADSTCRLIQTEFNSYIWWDLHNGSDTSGDFDPTLYGWRNNGDYGWLSSANARYPSFYAAKLLQYFARPSDSVLSATSDYLLLSAYATRRTNGALTLFVINKTGQTNFMGQISITNFQPSANALIQSYGIPQDEAVRTNGAAALQDILLSNFSSANTNFAYSFPPYSMTLFTFAPSAPQLTAFATPTSQLVLQLQGQPNTPYVIQASSDLVNWTSVSTNLLTGNLLNITNDISAEAQPQFLRAVWRP